MIGFWCGIYCIVEATERLFFFTACFFSRNENVRKNLIANVNAGEITREIIAPKRGSRVLSRRLFYLILCGNNYGNYLTASSKLLAN